MKTYQEQSTYREWFKEKTAGKVPFRAIQEVATSNAPSRLESIGISLGAGIGVGQVNNLIHDNMQERKKLAEEKEKLQAEHITELKSQLEQIKNTVVSKQKPIIHDEPKQSLEVATFSPQKPTTEPPAIIKELPKTAGILDSLGATLEGFMMKQPDSAIATASKALKESKDHLQTAINNVHVSAEKSRKPIDTLFYSHADRAINHLSKQQAVHEGFFGAGLKNLREAVAKDLFVKNPNITPEVLAKEVNNQTSNAVKHAIQANGGLLEIIKNTNHQLHSTVMKALPQDTQKLALEILGKNVATEAAIKNMEAATNAVAKANAEFQVAGVSARKQLGGLIGGIGAVQIGNELINYPSWRKGAIAETKAINQAMKAKKLSDLASTGLGVAAGVGALGLLGAGAYYNHIHDPYKGMNSSEPVVKSTPLLAAPVEADLGSSEAPVAWEKTAFTNEDSSFYDHMAQAGKEIKNLYNTTSKVKLGLGGLGALAVGALAHHGVKQLGGYKAVGHALLPEHMAQAEHINNQINPFNAIKSHTGKEPSMLKRYGVPVGAALAGGYIYSKLKPNREEKAANITPAQKGLALRDAYSNGALYKEFLAGRPSLSTPKALLVGALAGLALPTVAKGVQGAIQAYQQNKLNNQMMNLQMAQQNAMYGAGIDPYTQQQMILNGGALY